MFQVRVHLFKLTYIRVDLLSAHVLFRLNKKDFCQKICSRNITNDVQLFHPQM